MFLLTLAVGSRCRPLRPPHHHALVPDSGRAGRGALALASFGGWQSKESILAIVFVVGAARAFEGPTMLALVPGLVPAPLIPRAFAWSTSANQTATILGPALGGLLYVAGPTRAYGTASILFFAASTFIALIRIERTPPKREPVSLQSLFAGIAFIRSRPAILGAISLDLFAVLLRRGNSAFAGLCSGHSRHRAVGIGPAALSSSGWGVGHVCVLGAPPASAPGRAGHVRRRGDLWCCHDRFCAVDLLRAVTRHPGHTRRCGRH